MSSPGNRTSSLTISNELVQTIVNTGGYTHPLFNPTEAGTAETINVPLPGQGVLLLMGGLIEQSGALDHAIALLELRNVKFSRMVRAGSTISVSMTPLESFRTSSGKIIHHYRWVVVDENDDTVLEAESVMLMREKEKRTES